MNKKSDSNISLNKDFFTTEKSSDIFKEVEFKYDNYIWKGALPKFLEKQGLDLNDEEFNGQIEESYYLLNPTKRNEWIKSSDSQWRDKNSETYKVLMALYSAEWECRVCGPVPNVNAQPAARLRDLKKKGYIIASQRKFCKKCSKKTMHDLLIMLPNIEKRFSHGNELRKPMSEELKSRIKKTLGHKEVCFNVVRSAAELLVDHKFPSQRWSVPESDNPDNMLEKDIRYKFQLLSNQTNMWKSRYCDTCFKTGKRGDFMGIRWYYEGDEDWKGNTLNDEKGCIGCPWYDLELWKSKLKEVLYSK